MKRLGATALACMLAAGCTATSSKSTKPSRLGVPGTSKDRQELEERQVMKWAENEALVEWQVARLAASCNEVAATTQSPPARREALRLKAAYATSSYAILSGRNVLVQVLDFVAMAALTHQIWVEEGRAVSEFGAQAKPVEAAISVIRERTRTHSLTHISADELQEVEGMVRAWRKAHPGPVVVEFIRFEAFADEFASSVRNPTDLGGLFGRIAGGAHNVELLGERALVLTSRMPRLAEWHAEAAAANVLAQPQVADAMTALKQLGELQRVLPDQLKTLHALDSRLASLPAELADAVAKQPELKEALARVEQTGQQIKALEGSVTTLDKSVTALATQLAQLASATQPASLQQLADKTSDAFLVRVRSLLLLGTACAATLLLLHALLRRWSSRPQPREGGQP
jgi:hypothetical protein